jgi:phage repressor protein C with HTH and peptisase S24 domain
MEPEFEAGDIALVNPHLPLIPGSTCIFFREIDGEARATIKRLRRITNDSWLVRQWNPPEGQKPDFSLHRKEWATAHRVLGKYSRS